VKVTPSNQSLILAGEPPFAQTARLVASGTAPKRVTILAARRDATVVVQADYLSRDDTPSFGSQPPALQYHSHDAAAVMDTSSETPRRPASTSFYRTPLQLYARTQRGLEDTPKAALLDVFA
jgi:hypothetical protein